MFCGQHLPCAYLRDSRIDGAKHSAAILKLRVRRVRIIFRGDSGFCRQRIINGCERSGVHYIIGLARNAKLEARVEFAQFRHTQRLPRLRLRPAALVVLARLPPPEVGARRDAFTSSIA